jgi:hypothetical protein
MTFFYDSYIKTESSGDYNLLVFEYFQAQSVACLIASIIGLENQNAVQRQLDFWLTTYNMLFMKGILYDMKRGKCSVVMFCVKFSSLHILNSISYNHFPVIYSRIKKHLVFLL